MQSIRLIGYFFKFLKESLLFMNVCCILQNVLFIKYIVIDKKTS